MTNPLPPAFGQNLIAGSRHPVMWLLAAAGSIAAAEVYYVQPEIAAIAPSLRLSDIAIGVMSAVNQMTAARDEIPLWCKARAVTFYLLGVLAIGRVIGWLRVPGRRPAIAGSQSAAPQVAASQAGRGSAARIELSFGSITMGAKPCSRRISRLACGRTGMNSVRPPNARPATSSTIMRTASMRGF